MKSIHLSVYEVWPPTLLIYLFQFWWWPANSHQQRVTGTCLLAILFVAALKKTGSSSRSEAIRFLACQLSSQGQSLRGSSTGQETISPQINQWLFDWREERDSFLSLSLSNPFRKFSMIQIDANLWWEILKFINSLFVIKLVLNKILSWQWS